MGFTYEVVGAVMKPGERYSTSELQELTGMTTEQVRDGLGAGYAKRLFERSPLMPKPGRGLHRLWMLAP